MFTKLLSIDGNEIRESSPGSSGTYSVRGFLSTTAKKHGLKIESTKTEAGDRVYQIKR